VSYIASVQELNWI